MNSLLSHNVITSEKEGLVLECGQIGEYALFFNQNTKLVMIYRHSNN